MRIRGWSYRPTDRQYMVALSMAAVSLRPRLAIESLDRSLATLLSSELPETLSLSMKGGGQRITDLGFAVGIVAEVTESTSAHADRVAGDTAGEPVVPQAEIDAAMRTTMPARGFLTISAYQVCERSVPCCTWRWALSDSNR
jgi:hypothetical protein